jgi:hypothetical protein
MAGAAKRNDRPLQLAIAHQNIVSVIRRDREDANPDSSQRRCEGREDSRQIEVEWALGGHNAPPVFHPYSTRHAGRLTYDGQFIWRADPEPNDNL